MFGLSCLLFSILYFENTISSTVSKSCKPVFRVFYLFIFCLVFSCVYMGCSVNDESPLVVQCNSYLWLIVTQGKYFTFLLQHSMKYKQTRTNDLKICIFHPEFSGTVLHDHNK